MLKKVFLIFGLSLMMLSCTTTRNSTIVNDRDPAAFSSDRGSLAEYDMGPPKNSKWPDLFAETPNYRAYGKAVYQLAAKKYGIEDDQAEKFRWKVGPMWYRGRLTPNSVKVFIIGQEGAQDENTSNRTFTGSTGTKMQNFINYFGINRSYLFMNTFSYTITGQYGERYQPDEDPKKEALKSPAQVAKQKKEAEVRSKTLFWLAQNPQSAIVQHRHKMFDYMLSENKETIRLIIGVGSAGKDSLATWIQSHGGKCTSKQLSDGYCNADVIANGAIAIGVMHPGAASQRNGGAEAANSLQNQFARRADVVADFMKKNPNWLKPDPGMKTNFTRAYYYGDAAIPHRDFAFGTNWRLGNDGTATNRRGADGIQIYSDGGCYNNVARIDGQCDRAEKPKTLNVQYDLPKDQKFIMTENKKDIPWESPINIEGRRNYDQGPGEFAEVLMGQTGHPWPDFTSLGVTAHKSFGFGPIYRGNLENAEVLILGDQESQDDLFSTRALTGTGGQRLQTFLQAMGLKNNYAIIRTLPVDTLDLDPERVKEIALNSSVTQARSAIINAILKKNRTKILLTVGPIAAEVAKGIHPGVPVMNLDSPYSQRHLSQWKWSQNEITKLGLGIRYYKLYDGELTAIPRSDLPGHTRLWMGTSGTRASRAYTLEHGKKVWNGDYYQFNAPTWVNSKNYPANIKELNSSEQSSLRDFAKEDLLIETSGQQ